MSQFYELIEFIRAEVNKGLKRMSIPDEPRYLYDPIRYTLKGKGKRFRPILVHQGLTFVSTLYLLLPG
jgi:geranylgeranyl pyrophosphate synthase